MAFVGHELRSSGQEQDSAKSKDTFPGNTQHPPKLRKDNWAEMQSSVQDDLREAYFIAPCPPQAAGSAK